MLNQITIDSEAFIGDEWDDACAEAKLAYLSFIAHCVKNGAHFAEGGVDFDVAKLKRMGTSTVGLYEAIKCGLLWVDENDIRIHGVYSED